MLGFRQLYVCGTHNGEERSWTVTQNGRWSRLQSRGKATNCFAVGLSYGGQAPQARASFWKKLVSFQSCDITTGQGGHRSFPQYQQIFGTRSLIYFSVVVLKISWQKQLQFNETVHSIGEIKAAAARSGWRYHAHCQEADFKKCFCSPLVFTDIVWDPVTVRKCRHSQ